MAKAKQRASLSALVLAFSAAESAAHVAQEQAEIAEGRFSAALSAVLDYPAVAVADLLAKLQMADRFDGITEEANEPGQKLVAIRVIASAIRDAERLAKKGGAA